MKKVALYIRVSTIEQANEGYSIAAQKERLINYCKAKSWNIYDIYVDGGFSGSNIDRPGVQKMLNDLTNIDIVLVYKLDRLSRSQKDTLYLIEEKFLKNNVDFVSLQESFDTTTPFGRAMIGILSVFAQLERETITERTMMGKVERVKSGKWYGGGIEPTGYNYIQENNELVINEYEAMQVKEIFKLYNEGHGKNRIAKILNEKGYKKKNGNKWQLNAVDRILNNNLYIGQVTFNGQDYDGMHEPIIGKELFGRTKKLLNKRSSHSVNDSGYLLTGLIRCAYCGGRIKSSWSAKRKDGPRYYFYKCYSKVGNPIHMVVDPNCPAKAIKMDVVDKWVYEELKAYALDFKKIKESYNKLKGTKKDNSSKTTILKEIENIDKRIEKMMDLYMYDNIEASTISERIEKLYESKKQLQNTLSEVEETEDDTEISWVDLEVILKDFDNIWNEADNMEKRLIVKELTDEILLYRDKIKIKRKV